eukprot:gnl/TRDRNA2_/TRDRNA2_203908_c0_seq1.p1 gnl/TRDRNA2_/TRDRNA2_203908_c0~~gnl/TRDRNA2_/TRDRNA2_203908_c0_seq1.p1  ORF type:complete len:410 (-),score=59.59 gnl/TRDRNA2_/TRDRNA2_203908_c0_seq1:90-1319(-)
MLLFIFVSVLTWLALFAGSSGVHHRVEHLSEARRDIGIAVASGKAYFAGGCKDTYSAYNCDSPTATVDIFTANGSAGTATPLVEARGWPAGCAVGSKVLFAGGGTNHRKLHSRTADILDASTDASSSQLLALSVGRWGIACTTVGSAVYFAGGKVVAADGNYHMTDVVDIFQENGTWAVAPWHLSKPRESAAAASGPGGSALFVGGWVTLSSLNAHPVTTVDILSDPAAPDGGATNSHLSSPAYWPGVAVAADGKVYVVGNELLSQFDGSKWVSSPLPDELVGSAATLEGGGAVPNAHVPNNGVAVGDLVCFYGWRPKKFLEPKRFLNGVFCYDTVHLSWSLAMKCTTVHRGGGIATIDGLVLVAGGYDPENKNAPTDVVDIFDIAALAAGEASLETVASGIVADKLLV